MNDGERASILQATFEHYYGMAMDHHTKAATTSNILLAIVGAILVLVGYDGEISRNPVDIGSSIAVIIIGAFGAIWVLKQHERYYFWEFTATQYQIELQEIMGKPKFKTGLEYEDDAKAYTEEEFGWFVAKFLRDRYLWAGLHVLVVLGGIGLLLTSFL